MSEQLKPNQRADAHLNFLGIIAVEFLGGSVSSLRVLLCFSAFDTEVEIWPRNATCPNRVVLFQELNFIHDQQILDRTRNIAIESK
jgi:hypothetical protein